MTASTVIFLSLAWISYPASAVEVSPQIEFQMAQAGSIGGQVKPSTKDLKARTKKRKAKKSKSSFEGHWSGWLQTYGGSFDKPVEATFGARVLKGQLSGQVYMYGEHRTLSGQVASNGALVNGRLRGRNSYRLTGSIHKGNGVAGLLGWKLRYRMKRAR